MRVVWDGVAAVGISETNINYQIDQFIKLWNDENGIKQSI